MIPCVVHSTANLCFQHSFLLFLVFSRFLEFLFDSSFLNSFFFFFAPNETGRDETTHFSLSFVTMHAALVHSKNRVVFRIENLKWSSSRNKTNNKAIFEEIHKRIRPWARTRLSLLCQMISFFFFCFFVHWCADFFFFRIAIKEPSNW